MGTGNQWRGYVDWRYTEGRSGGTKLWGLTEAEMAVVNDEA